MVEPNVANVIGSCLTFTAILHFHSKARSTPREEMKTSDGIWYRTPVWLKLYGGCAYGTFVGSAIGIVLDLDPIATVVNDLSIPIAIFLGLIFFLIQRWAQTNEKHLSEHALTLVSFSLGLIVALTIYGQIR